MKKRSRKELVSGPVALIILDGWGIRRDRRHNAVLLGKTPFLDMLCREYPHTSLRASGEHVGLPKGFQGNSEVGHINIGAGRVVRQEISRISDSIRDGSFFTNPAFLRAIRNCKKNNSALHLMGLVQREGVHAMSDHLVALLRLAKRHRIADVHVHCFTDGRDTPPKSAAGHISWVERRMTGLGVGRISSIIGRFYAMDRDTRWQRVKAAYDCLAEAKGSRARSWREALRQAYYGHDTDEFIKPTAIGDFSGIRDKDSVIFFNYRLDRARQLTHAFCDPSFRFFRRKRLDISFTAMTAYYRELPECASLAFPNISNRHILGEVISDAGMRQLRIAETEKYAHVTYFFNSEREAPFPMEDRILVPSPRDVSTYDQKPEMSAYLITGRLLSELRKSRHRAIILNFANCDMVGHTGNLRAAKLAVNAVDECLSKIVPEVMRRNGACLIISDHGNCEDMSPKTRTSHTTNDVPCILASGLKLKLRKGRLADVAPTMLELLGLRQPRAMTGKSLALLVSL